MKFKIGDKVRFIKTKNNTNMEGIVINIINLYIDYLYAVRIVKMSPQGNEIIMDLYWREEELELVENTPTEKPPLGVMPRHIYEIARVQDLCRALYDYSRYGELKPELMRKWAEELIDRLYNVENCED